jgi:hypothetical protein
VRIEQERRWHQADRSRQFTTSSAKAACKAVMTKMAALFDASCQSNSAPGFQLPRACTEAAQRTLLALTSRASNPVKVSLSWTSVTHSIKFAATTCFRPCTMSYQNCIRSSTRATRLHASLLNFGDHLLLSDEDVRQGDPLGSLLFCASSLKLVRSMASEFNLWYLDR